jgi:hypothetical protein
MYFLGNEIAPFFKVASESRKIDLYTAATEQQSSAAIVGDHSSDPGMATAGARRAREDASVAQRERASHGGDNPFLMTQDDDSQCSIKKSLPQAQLFKKKKSCTLLFYVISRPLVASRAEKTPLPACPTALVRHTFAALASSAATASRREEKRADETTRGGTARTASGLGRETKAVREDPTQPRWRRVNSTSPRGET